MVREARTSDALPRERHPLPAEVEMPTDELKKHVTFYVPISAWKALRAECFERGEPITQVVLAELRPFFRRLLKKHKPKGKP